MGGVIQLNSPANNLGKQNFLSKVLDIISAPLSQPVTTFTKGITAGAAKVKETREKIATGKASGAQVIATTLGTTALIGGTIASLGGLGVGTGAAATATKIVTSTTARSLSAVAALAPEVTSKVLSSPEAVTTIAASAAGGPIAGLVVGLEQGGGLVAEAAKDVAQKVKEADIVGAVKTTGAVAAGVAAVTGAGIVAAKVLGKEKEIKEAPINNPSISTPAVVSPTSEPVISSGIAETAEAAASKIPQIMNKINFKPSINIAIAH